MKKLQLGDMVDFSTPNGKAYAQLINSHRQYGSLLRVLCGTHGSRPADLDGVLRSETQFLAFFPLQAAVRAGLVDVFATKAVPEAFRAFPLFRAGVADPKTGKVATWWLWDGEKEWKVGALTPEQKRFPIRGDTILIERISSGWTAETDATT